MRYLKGILILSILFSSHILANMSCPSDSSYHVDTREMLPDGSPNPTYGQEIATGLCGCLAFVDGAVHDGNMVTFTIRIVDNEPIRGIELDIYHDSPVLTYNSVQKGSKIEDVMDEEGNPRTMTLLGNYLEDRLKVLVYSTSRARTHGDGLEGDLVHVTYEINEGESLPEAVTFYLGLANLPGTSAHPELLNVVCEYPNEGNPVIVSTSSVSVDNFESVPNQFALHQNYPNPFNPSTQISFDVPKDGGHIMLSIYNILGQNVHTLVNGVMNPGRYTLEWDATDELGNPASSGIYFYEIRSATFTARKKMLLIR
jgi:hypothetical protein